MKLKSKVLESFEGVAYGHTTLEAMQNWKLSKVDLLVREIIQNCSDAADPIKGTEYFKVDFTTNTFDGRKFINSLDGFDESIIKKYGKENSNYLEVRDTGTIGLIGAMTRSSDDEHGNYYRLVFDTGKAQTQKNSGGNWGYGKSAYYMLGEGFVIYYSQIKEDDEYKSRLIVTLIEDEEKEDAILRNHKNGSNSAGKAWWGSELVGSTDNPSILPLQDKDEIKEYLSIFGIQPFAEEETGTSVIIPYVDFSDLTKNMITEEMDVSDDIKDRCPWMAPDLSGFENYLNLAIQKWYAPAINNKDLYKLIGKKWLYVSVNGKPIPYRKMYPFFQLTQRLYTAGLAKTKGKSEEVKDWNVYYENNITPISIRNYIDNSSGGNTEVGYLVTARVPASIVNKDAGNNLNPYILLGYYEEAESNRPLVMFARRLGMVIDYSYKDEWVHGIPAPEEKDEYIISFFVPYLEDTEQPEKTKKLKSTLSVKQYAGKSLEEYLISCEASDHAGWEDHDRMTIVSSIQNRVSDNLKNLIKGTIIPPSGNNSDRLGGAFAKMIGISRGKFGKSGGSGSGNGSGGSSSSKKVTLSSNVIEFNGNRQLLSVSLVCKKGTRSILISPVLHSDGKNLISTDWEKDIGSVFPVFITEFKINKMVLGAEEKEINITCSEINPISKNQDVIVTLRHEVKNYKNDEKITSCKNTLISIDLIRPLGEVISIEGSIQIETTGTEYEYDLAAAEE